MQSSEFQIAVCPVSHTIFKALLDVARENTVGWYQFNEAHDQVACVALTQAIQSRL